MQLRSLLRTLISVAATIAVVSPAMANDPFPSKPVRIVVGFSPGGSNDIVARLLAPKLAEGLGQQVLVENKPGAGGNIAAQTMLGAPPDGHTLMMCTTGTVSIQPHLTKAPFNPETDLLPVTLIANAPYLLLVNASIPATTVKELISYAKSHPGQLNFASSGNATGGHLAGEMFKSKAGVDIVHVPYKGTGQAMTDLLAGQISIIFDQAVSSMPYAKSGKLRILGVASPQRLKGLPEVPTISESGVPNFDPVTWTGLCAAKGTPAAAILRVQQEVAKVLATPEISQKLIAAGLEPVASTPEQFRAFLAADKIKWGTVIKDAGVKVD
ncbi:Bug family tripartite tricarboxylate transporter substrate binding protein [Variovorax sp. LT1R16]|uniref:Bug family tripartite tricarboxylate transporter substrate binding protein n=1 Tax=Variovorax sp. LT1R16 TaxID=3443728 RepID=UPI003F4849CA